MAGKFEGKVALVTGGSSGMGQASAVMFAGEGAKVVISADKNVEGGEETVRMIKNDGGDASFIRADMANPADVRMMINKTVELYGRLDYAYNNAGIPGSHTSVVDCTEESWERTININLRGIWLCMKYEIPEMLKNGGGAIVNCASGAGLKAIPGNADYVASKFGIVGLTRAAALENAKSGIRVNVVCPGIIDTPMSRNTIFKPGQGPPGGFGEVIPGGRVGTSEEIAEAVIWLCSDAASYVTGLAIPVDGGLNIK